MGCSRVIGGFVQTRQDPILCQWSTDLPDQPPSTASRTMGRKKSPMLAQRATVMEEGFARLHVLEYCARIPASFGPDGGAEAPTDGEIPSFGMPRRAVWDPDVSWATEVSTRRVKRSRERREVTIVRSTRWQEARFFP